MLYISVIAAANVIIIVGNVLVTGAATLPELLRIAAASLGGTIAVIAIDGVTAFLIRRLPEGWFSADRKMFFVREGERRLYARLGVKKWKSKVPELGGFSGFHKDKLQSPSDAAYLARFLLESNYGVVIHLANAVCGFGIAFLPFCRQPSIWIPIFAVNFVLSLLPVAILRYNTPVLRRLYVRQRGKGGEEGGGNIDNPPPT